MIINFIKNPKIENKLANQILILFLVIIGLLINPVFSIAYRFNKMKKGLKLFFTFVHIGGTILMYVLMREIIKTMEVNNLNSYIPIRTDYQIIPITLEILNFVIPFLILSKTRNHKFQFYFIVAAFTLMTSLSAISNSYLQNGSGLFYKNMLEYKDEIQTMYNSNRTINQEVDKYIMDLYNE